MSGAQEAFEIAKDSGKLKVKLKELADAQAALDTSHAKVTAKNKELFAEYDAKKAEMDRMVEDAKERQKQAESAANAAMRPVEKAKGELAQEQKRLEKMSAKLDHDTSALKKRIEAMSDAERMFEERVTNFEKAVKSVVEAAR